MPLPCSGGSERILDLIWRRPSIFLTFGLYSIMGMTFLPKTHLFFSCGKDGAVKQWDADTFNHITTLSPSHHAEAWAVVPSPSGMSLVSCSHDKSIRLWEKTEEVLVLEEEREQAREKEFDMEIEREDNPVVSG